MSGHGVAACRVAHNGPPQWAAPSRMRGEGLCEGIWGTAASFDPGFSAAC